MIFSKWFKEHFNQIQKDYFEFLSIASISTDPKYKDEVYRAAHFLESYFKDRGFSSELIETSHYPIVYAEDLSKGKEAKTLLIYGHYDVQPVDPIDLWKNNPFEPRVEGKTVYARGASDNKGQIFYAVLACIAVKELLGSLPINVKFCIEGEEESGSRGLKEALSIHKEKLSCSSLLVVDFDSMDDGSPAVTLGARGCMAFEVKMKGSSQDLHSGLFGGIAYNPIRALTEVLSSFWNEKGEVQIEGFYEGVLPPSKKDLEAFSFTKTENDLEKTFGIACLAAPKKKTLMESNWFMPTVEINGICGGYIGEGSKTVIPSTAFAKVTCRLVPGQDPKKLERMIQKHLEKYAPSKMELHVEFDEGVEAFRGCVDSSIVKATQKAALISTGETCRLILSGGSIPIVAEMVKQLECDVAGVGFALSTDQIHAPNEHFDMDRFEKGFLTVANILREL